MKSPDVVIGWENYQKHNSEGLVMSSLTFRLGILCIFFEDSYKIIWTFEWQLSDDEDEIQLSISRLRSRSPKTLDWWAIILAHLFKPISVSIQYEGEDPC